MCKNSVRWLYRLEGNFAWESRHPVADDLVFRDKTGVVRLIIEADGTITVTKGYAWNGAARRSASSTSWSEPPRALSMQGPRSARRTSPLSCTTPCTSSCPKASRTAGGTPTGSSWFCSGRESSRLDGRTGLPYDCSAGSSGGRRGRSVRRGAPRSGLRSGCLQHDARGGISAPPRPSSFCHPSSWSPGAELRVRTPSKRRMRRRPQQTWLRRGRRADSAHRRHEKREGRWQVVWSQATGEG